MWQGYYMPQAITIFRTYNQLELANSDKTETNDFHARHIAQLVSAWTLIFQIN